MIVLFILAGIAGIAVSGLTGSGTAGLIVGIIFFVCGLPGTLLLSFIHGEVSYAEDRADYRETMSRIAAAEIAYEHEYAEDERTEHLVEAVKSKRCAGDTYNDNRQVHIHEAQ